MGLSPSYVVNVFALQRYRVLLLFFFFMLRIQTGEQEQSEIFFFLFGSTKCIRTVISA